MDEWMNELTIEDIPEQYQQMAQLIGVDNLLKLSDEFGGDKPYIPKREALVRSVRDRRIKKQFTGYNARELAQRFDLSVTWVLQICRGEPPDQISIFDTEGLFPN